MPLLANRYFPDAEVNRLTVGSYEQLSSRVEAAVRNEAVRLFGQKVEVAIGATFASHAMVFSEDGRVLDVQFEDVRGTIKIVSFAAPKVAELASTDSRRAHVQTESKHIAELLTKGSLDEATSRLKALSSLVEGKSPHHDEQIVSAMIAFRRSDRPWKATFHEKADTIKRLVLDEAEKIQKDRIQIKFRSLYDGTVARSDLGKYSDLVETAIKDIGARASELRNQLASQVSTARAETADPSIVQLWGFAEDLIEDLRLVSNTLTEALRRVSRTDCLGRLHDALAQDFINQELAARFVLKTAQRLVGAAA